MTAKGFAQDANNKLNECDANTACAPNDVTAKVQELASSVVQKVQDVAADVSNKAQDWAGNVADKAQATAAAVGHKTDDGIAAVGHKMSAFGSTVRGAVPHNSALGSAATAVADELQAGGQYLEGHGLEEIGKDLTEVVRRHPIPSVLVGFGIGCLIGMTILRTRS